MDPVTIFTIARAGGGVLRALAGLLPGKAGQVAGKLATVAEATQGLGDAARAQAVEKTIEAMSPEERRELVALTVEIRKLDNEARRDTLDAETSRHAQAQETIRAEIREGSPFARDTRPYIARQSFAIGAAYGFLAELVKIITAANGAAIAGADPAILGVLFGPCVWYMTARTVDGFTAQGRTV
ncbi:MAG: hypothetical protein AB7Q01_16425 [Gammaproteobacteria bacterium]